MDLSRSTQQLNNMNVFTFVKEIYSSLKHITTKLHTNETKVNSHHKDIQMQISKLEAKIDHIIQEQNSIKNMINNYYNSDQNLGSAIQTKMENLLSGSSNVDYSSDKLDLKPMDLTLANVDENNYTFADIQTSLDTNDVSFNHSLTTGLLTDVINPFISDDLDTDNYVNIDNNNNKKTVEENITDLVC